MDTHVQLSPQVNVLSHFLPLTQFNQVIGPLRARVDSRISLGSRGGEGQLLEVVYGLDFPIGKVGAPRLVAWYSPTRQEGMAELRMLER